jgi:2-methylcitrate dehydratase PrpD
VECAVLLHPLVKDRISEIELVRIATHESAIRIINKAGLLNNPADRDHCLQYVIAIGLIFGGLAAEDYEDKTAADPRIDALRAKMTVTEDKGFSKDYLDPEKRSIANTVQVFFKDGSKSDSVTVEYPIGHRRRRREGIPLLKDKARRAFSAHFGEPRAERLMAVFADRSGMEASPCHEFVSQFVK